MHDQTIRLSFTGTGLQFLGRGLLFILMSLPVLTLPWAWSMFLRWFGGNVQAHLPDAPQEATGEPFRFDGRGAAVFGYFLGLLLITSLPSIMVVVAGWDSASSQAQSFEMIGSILLLPFAAWFALRCLIWAVENTALTREAYFRFEGGYAAYLGWFALLNLPGLAGGYVGLHLRQDAAAGAVLLAAGIVILAILLGLYIQLCFLRWICGNMWLGRLGLRFRATFWELLWRSVAATLFSLPVVTIPWAAAWLTRWMIGRTVLVPGASALLIERPEPR